MQRVILVLLSASCRIMWFQVNQRCFSVLSTVKCFWNHFGFFWMSIRSVEAADTIERSHTCLSNCRHKISDTVEWANISSGVIFLNSPFQVRLFFHCHCQTSSWIHLIHACWGRSVASSNGKKKKSRLSIHHPLFDIYALVPHRLQPALKQ